MNKTLRDRRIEKGETLKQLAEAIGASFQAVSEWERGIARPVPKFIPRLAAHFGVTPQAALESLENSRLQSAASAAS